jgi:CRP/FNR family transcriptional regulator, cyclic AMP receptor protein
VQWRLLAEVPEEQVRLLLSVARRRRFARGEVVFHRDDPGDSLHLIAAGHFAVKVMTPVGDTVTIAVRGPGENFGEMALVGAQGRRSATVEALERAETFAVYKDDFERLRREHPSVDQVVTAFLAGEVRILNERLLEALYVPSERRLLRRLVELARVYGRPDGPAELPLTQEQLAMLAGASRGTVNMVLRDEQKRGTLELDRGKTIILDLEALQKRAR